jgi:hypothetical protein
MAKRDYYPRAENRRLLFVQNLTGKLLDGTARKLDVSKEQVDQIEAMRRELEKRARQKESLRQDAMAATQAYLELDQQLEELVRRTVTRLKTHERYESALGADLGIEGGPDPRTLAARRASPAVTPRLRLIQARSGQVVLAFSKEGHDGIELWSGRRTHEGGEEIVEPVLRAMYSPAVDPRPNLTTGPEMRWYAAYYLLKDTCVGEMSARMIVTVPAKAAHDD